MEGGKLQNVPGRKTLEAQERPTTTTYNLTKISSKFESQPEL